MNSEITLLELNLFIKFEDFPYLGIFKHLDANELDKLESFATKIFYPEEMFTEVIYKEVNAIKQKLQSRIKFPNHTSFLLTYKLSHYLAVPPTIVDYSLRVQARLNTEKGPYKGSNYEGLTEACCLVATLKLMWGLDSHTKHSYPIDKFGNLNLELWSELIRRCWLMLPEYSNLDDRIVASWDKPQMNNYMDWFHQNILEDRQEVDQKFCTLFPLLKHKRTKKSLAKLKSRLPTEHNLDAIRKVVRNSIFDMTEKLPDKNRVECGKIYRSYSNTRDFADDESISPIIKTLYFVVELLLGVKLETFMDTLTVLEHNLEKGTELYKQKRLQIARPFKGSTCSLANLAATQVRCGSSLSALAYKTLQRNKKRPLLPKIEPPSWSRDAAISSILYETPVPKIRKDQTHVLQCLVQNEPGVLARVSSALAGRGFNIDSLVGCFIAICSSTLIAFQHFLA
ncbi:hypothetical protein FF38_02247, partial [Lucilia cuprina]